jgi:polyphosphate kinase
LPDRCFGIDRELPEWLIRPWQLLQEASQRQRPLADRLADLTQVGQALDDLFAVHLPCEAAWFETPQATGLSIDEDIPRWVDELIAEATYLFLHQLRPELLAQGIYVRAVEQLDEWQRDWLHDHFMQRIYPLLTPLAVDPGRPFPYISSDSLNLLVHLHRVDGVRSGNLVDRTSLFARVKVPRSTPRLVAVPTQLSSHNKPTVLVSSADLVRYYVHRLFTGMPVRQVYLFRLVRGEQPLPGVSTSTSTRPRRQEDKPVVRLDVEQRMSPPVLKWLMEHLRLPGYALAQHDRLFDWSCLPDLAASVGARQLRE